MNIEAQNPGNISKSSAADLDCFSYGDELIIQDIGVITEIGAKVSNVLNYDDKIAARNSQNRVDFLLGELKIEVNRISGDINYNYEPDNYIYKLIQPENISMSLFDKFLDNHDKLKCLFLDILGLFESSISKETIKQAIIKDYFCDLIFESMPLSDIGEDIEIKFDSI